MSQTPSPSTGRRYGVRRVCRVWDSPRSTFYARRERRQKPRALRPARRGPAPAIGDADLVKEIRQVLKDSLFVGEGYRKVWARLRAKGVRTSPKRVLRVMREAGLQAPTRPGHAHGPKAHDGTIITDRPDEMWGIDGTSCQLTSGYTASIFVAVDHGTCECVGIHAARPGTRFEAVEPLRQAVPASFGCYDREVAHGLTLRHDHGSQFVSDHFQEELDFLGIKSSPAYVREPEGNGCVERFIRTLKEQLLWLRNFDSVEELRQTLLDFKDRYNQNWLIQRHHYRTPAAVRADHLAGLAEAA